MLRKRILFGLIYKDGFFFQSRNFNLQKVGNIDWLLNNYNFQKVAVSIDELIIVDAVKDSEKVSKKFHEDVLAIIKKTFIPLTLGGGIRNIYDITRMFSYGADKILLNTACYSNKNLVMDAVNLYGSQSVVAQVDYSFVDDSITLYSHGGMYREDIGLVKHLESLMEIGTGEIILNCITRDGTGFGYHTDIIELISKIDLCPLIIMGGAGKVDHFALGLKFPKVSGVATANLFNFMGDSLEKARIHLINKGGNLAE